MANLTAVDWLIMLLYFGFVVGIGFALKPKMKTSKDFLQAGRALPAWICGLAFLSANLGAQEVIGMGASGAKYGLETAQFLRNRRDLGDDFCGHLHDAVLLRVKGALGAGVFAVAIRREDARIERMHVCGDDGVQFRDLDVCDGAADAGAACV